MHRVADFSLDGVVREDFPDDVIFRPGSSKQTKSEGRELQDKK